MVHIEPLTEETLAEASRKADAIFVDEPEPPSFWFEQSLGINVQPEYWKRDGGTITLQYFLARDEETGEVLGGTGYYTTFADASQAVWLGWYWVDRAYRGKGIGRKLLEYVIDLARAQRKQYVRLYTSDDPNEQAANALYDKLGFAEWEWKERPSYRVNILCKQLKITP